MGMPNFGSTLVLAFVFVAVLLVVIIHLRRCLKRTKTFSATTVVAVDEDHRKRERRWQWDSLTPREMEVANLGAMGKHTAEIAKELHISYNTVDSHLKHIYEKLNVHTRVELARTIRELVD
jgi:DNA-binding CsgD family transcriptional regulator